MRLTTKQKAIRHYDTMIEWARQQPARGKANYGEMFSAIYQNWYSNHCSYCKKYFKYGPCSKCPLNTPTGCCNRLWGLWNKMNNARTWGTWVKRAEAVRQYIIDNG